MNKFKKKYQVWARSDYKYLFQEFDTLEECIACEKYTEDWYITKRVDMEITDKEDESQTKKE